MKRKILALILGVLLIVSIVGLVACNPQEPVQYPIDSATDFIFASYGNSDSESKVATSKDKKLPATTPVGELTFTLTWTIKETGLKNVSVETDTDGNPYIHIKDTMSGTEENYTLVVTITGEDGAERVLEFRYYYPAFKPVSYDAFKAACEAGSPEAVTIKAYVLGMIKTGSSAGSIYAQDADGNGYYVYNPGWTADEKADINALAEAYAPGTEIFVTGTGTVYSGQYEFNKGAAVTKTGGADATSFVVQNATKDWSAAHNNTDESLINYQNTLVQLDECILTASEGAYYYFVLNGIRFNVYDNTYFLTSDEGTAWKTYFTEHIGQAVTIKGLVSVYSGAYQIYPIFVGDIATAADIVAEAHTPKLTKAELVELAMEIHSIKDTIYLNGVTEQLETKTPFDGITVEWAFEDASKAEGLATMTADYKITYTVGKVAKTVALLATFKCEGVTPVERVFDVALVPPVVKDSIADFLALDPSDDIVYAIKGWVVADATSGRGSAKAGSFVIADETGAVFSYEKFDVEVGDYVQLFGLKQNADGTKAAGGKNKGVPQIKTIDYELLTPAEGAKSPYAAQKAAAEELKAGEIDLSKLDKDTVYPLTGKLLKITGATFVKTSYSEGQVDGAQVLSLYLNSDVKADDWHKKDVVIYGYVRGCVTNSYLTIQVAEIEDAPLPAVSDDKAVAYEKGKLEFVSAIDKNAEITLATAGIGYTDVAISWALKEASDVAVIADGKLKVTLGAEKATITLVATVSRGQASDTVEFPVSVASAEIDWKDGNWAVAEAKKLDGDKKEISEGWYFIYGEVLDDPTPTNCNFHFVGLDETNGGIVVYGLWTEDGTQRYGSSRDIAEIPVKKGDTVYLYAQLQNYQGKLEIVNARLQPAPKAGSCAAAPFTVAGVKEAAKDLATDKSYLNDGNLVFVKGIVSDAGSFNEKYGNWSNIKIKDADNTEISIYCLYPTETLKTIEVGDIIVVRVSVQLYSSKLQLTYCSGKDNPTIVSVAKPAAEPEQPELPSEPKHAGTEADPYTVEDVLVLGATLKSNEEYYKVNDAAAQVYITGVVSDAGSFTSYGNWSNIKIKDADDNEITIYRLYPTDTLKTICVNDTIVIHSCIQLYGGKVQITVSKGADNKGLKDSEIVSRTAGTSAIKVSSTIANAEVKELSATSAKNDSTFTFKVAAAEGYEIVAVKVNGEAVTATDGVYTGTVAGNTTIEVETKVAGAADALKATIKHTSSSTTNMTEVGNAEILGLDKTLFTVNAAKFSGSNLPGLNKDGSIRMYKNESVEFTVTIAAAYKIVSVKVTLASGSPADLSKLKVTDGTNVITETEGLYTVNGNTVVFRNTDSSSQIYIDSIEIVYEAVAE